MASLLKEHFLAMGCHAPPQQLSDAPASVPGARALSGLQSRKRIAPLISEFQAIYSVEVPQALASRFLSPGKKLLTDWQPGAHVSCQPPAQVLPAGSRVLRAHVVQGDVGMDDELQPNLTGSEVSEAMREGKPETLAKAILSQNVVGSKDLRALLDILPSELPHEVADASECGHLSMSKSFQVGSFVHGEVQGVRSATRKFPLVTTLVCRYVKQLFPNMQFGTVGLFRDVMALPHKDSSHEHSTDSAIAAISSFHQGGLWFEDPNQDHELEVGPAKVKGTVMQVDRRGFRFDGSRLHATMPWKGRRDVVVAYLAKDVGKLNDVDKAFLIDLGFPLDPATCVSRCGPHPKDKVKAVIGVYRTPDQFVEEAMRIGHPALLESLMPVELLAVVQKHHRVGEGCLARELGDQEEALKAMPQGGSQFETTAPVQAPVGGNKPWGYGSR